MISTSKSCPSPRTSRPNMSRVSRSDPVDVWARFSQTEQFRGTLLLAFIQHSITQGDGCLPHDQVKNRLIFLCKCLRRKHTDLQRAYKLTAGN